MFGKTWRPAATEVDAGPTTSSFLLGLLAIVAVAAVGYLATPLGSSAGVALYQRPSAIQHACKAAADAIATLRKGRPTVFLDDCAVPTVTAISSLPGRLIVTRVVDEPSVADRQVTYSVMVDGQGQDHWRILEVRLAPNRLTLDASLLNTKVPVPPRHAQQ